MSEIQNHCSVGFFENRKSKTPDRLFFFNFQCLTKNNFRKGHSPFLYDFELKIMISLRASAVFEPL